MGAILFANVSGAVGLVVNGAGESASLWGVTCFEMFAGDPKFAAGKAELSGHNHLRLANVIGVIRGDDRSAISDNSRFGF